MSKKTTLILQKAKHQKIGRKEKDLYLNLQILVMIQIGHYKKTMEHGPTLQMTLHITLIKLKDIMTI